MQKAKQNFSVQLFITILSIVLFAAKMVAYYYTHSLAILTDALESIVNILAGFIGLYSLYVAAKPSDVDHPYADDRSKASGETLSGVELVAVLDDFVFVLGEKLGEGIDRRLI